MMARSSWSMVGSLAAMDGSDRVEKDKDVDEQV